VVLSAAFQPHKPDANGRKMSGILEDYSTKMYIKKQRLLTPGPTPLYPPALHAMMRSDMHHRTEDFRKVYRAIKSIE
jgi:hypothetical protein